MYKAALINIAIWNFLLKRI